ncbi:hypothetical protein GCM10027037_30800 [Mucilaginibacter koreensis]
MTPKQLIGFILLLSTVFVSSKSSAQTEKQLLKKLRGLRDQDSAAVMANQLLQQARQKHDVPFEARIRLAQAYQAYGSGLEAKALAYGRQGFQLVTVKDTATYVLAGDMVAYMLSRQDKNAEALQMAFKVLRVADAHGWKKESIWAKICVTDIYRAFDDIKHALPYAQQAADEALAMKDTAGYVGALSNLSNLHSAMRGHQPHNLPLAVKEAEITLREPYSHFVKDDFTRARYMTNLGRLYEMTHQLDKAEAILKKSLALIQQKKFTGLEIPALNELATVMNDRHQYQAAINYDLQALAKLPLSQTNRAWQRNIYNRLADAYEGLKNYERALEYTRKGQAIEDSIKAVNQTNIAQETDAKYKADKRLLKADSDARLAHQQRNFILIISGFGLAVLLVIYFSIMARRRKEAELLTEQNKQLARLDAMKSRFFANISHELRTPLTLIMGPTDQLLNQGKALSDDQHRKLLQSVMHNSRKLLGMVNELLDLGKIEARNLPVNLQPVALSSYLQVLYQGFASAAAYKGVYYSMRNTVDKSISVQLDKEKFEKIINNFISNAIKFTPADHTVTVTASFHNDELLVEVADTGSGISPEDLPHIFDRYYQGTRPYQQAEGGTGIGLAIAREFAELLGGKVSVQSQWGQGATFSLRLPLSPALVDEVVTEMPATHEASQLPESNGSQLVMLVEDHPEMAAHISSVLQPIYRVVTARNGIDALHQLENMAALPDLILSDVMMPGMDGFTLLEELKKHSSYFSIPVIMLTALADSKNRLKALNIGVDDYLSKPFTGNELLLRINNLLQNAAARTTKVVNEQPVYEPTPTEPGSIAETEDVVPEVPVPASPADLVWLAQLEELVRKYVGKTDLSIELISVDLAISQRQLFRRIKQLTGLTPNKYIRTIRLQVAREAIESGRYRTIAEIAYAAGFETPAYFNKLFKEAYGRDAGDLL